MQVWLQSWLHRSDMQRVRGRLSRVPDVFGYSMYERSQLQRPRSLAFWNPCFRMFVLLRSWLHWGNVQRLLLGLRQLPFLQRHPLHQQRPLQ